MEQQSKDPGEAIRKKKEILNNQGTIFIILGVVGFFLGFYPIIMLETKGLFSLGALILGILGMRKKKQSKKVTDSDVVRLAKELNEAITPEWIILALGVDADEAEMVYSRLESKGIIKEHSAAFVRGSRIGRINIGDDPIANEFDEGARIEREKRAILNSAKSRRETRSKKTEETD